MTHNLTTLRRTIAELLAAATLEKFPHATLVGGKGSSLGFHYDFIFPFPFQKEFLPILEDAIRSLIKEKRQIELREMMPQNASLFFEHHDQAYLAEKAKKLEGTLCTIFQVGDFYDLAPPSFLKNLENEVFFKLTEVYSSPEGVTRIEGTAFFEKTELKTFLKKMHRYPETHHLVLGKQMDLFTVSKEGLCHLHPKGEWIKQQLLELWKQEHLQQNFLFPSIPPFLSKQAILKAHLPFGPRVAEIIFCKNEILSDELIGMFTTSIYTQDIAHIFCGEGDLIKESISSLQFITKISKILSFEQHWVLCVGSQRHSASWRRAIEILQQALFQCQFSYELEDENASAKGPRLELRVQDGLGRYWSSSYLEIDCERMCLARSTFGSLERCIALLLEQSEGMLPLWLAPEQARVITVGHNVKDYAKLCMNDLQALGSRVGIDEDVEQKLGSRVYRTLEAKVPYTIFIGEQEKKLGLVTVKANGSQIDKKMTVVELAQRLSTKRKD